MLNKALPITVIIAAKNEAVNLPKCLFSLKPASRIILLDSNSTDETTRIARSFGAEVFQFKYTGRYPKKRQWALENITVNTEWIMLLDADEVVPSALWDEIALAVMNPICKDAAFFIKKGFHFLGRRFRYGGFSFQAVLLFRNGMARFERLMNLDVSGLDMEVHERIIVDGGIGKFSTPLIHEDFKGLESYIARHNQYSTWEAFLRFKHTSDGIYGEETIQAKLFGNPQEKRRWLKKIIIHIPFEQWIWFIWHYFICLGFLEGRVGLIACQIRSSSIAQTRAKLYELRNQRVTPPIKKF